MKESEKESRIGGRYMLGPKIGGGSFGDIFLVSKLGTKEFWALKREEERSKHQQLQCEGRVLRAMEGGVGFAKLDWVGSEHKHNYLVMDLLGPSIEDLFVVCGRKLSLKTTLMLADQFIQRVEWMHRHDYIHRDIKPQNFLMGLKMQSHIVHLIDFGLSHKYRSTKSQQHIAYKENKSMTGTVRYASINTHMGIEQSRRDDLQSIGYVLVYLLQGFLPWQGIRANTKKEKYQKIMEKKMLIPVEMQCKNLPMEFATFMNYARALKFDEQPNYNYLRSLFLRLLAREELIYDYNYDWCTLTVSHTIHDTQRHIQLVASTQKVKQNQINLEINDDDDCIEEEIQQNQESKPLLPIVTDRLFDQQQKKNRLIFDQEQH